VEKVVEIMMSPAHLRTGNQLLKLKMYLSRT
jgi:hypothetical protein